MASHPYISGAGNIAQMIGFLRKNFPATVTADTVKKFALAPKNESYVINALQFIGVIDEEGKRTERGQDVFVLGDDEFPSAFEAMVIAAYEDLFDLRADDAWTLTKNELTSYFRTTDKTSEVIGSRQAAVFQVFRSLAGHEQPNEKGKHPLAAAGSSSYLPHGSGVASASRVFDSVNDVFQVLDAFIGEGCGDCPVVVAKGVVADAEAAIFAEHFH